jgi:hypothetical protein
MSRMIRSNIGFTVGYVMAFVGFFASAWNIVLERPVWLSSTPSVAWLPAVFFGVMIIEMSEVRRVKTILGDQYPKAKIDRKVLVISLIATVAILAFILK